MKSLLRQLFVAIPAALLVASATVYAFVIDEANARLEDGVIRVDADIDFRFSPEAMEALDNGVPLTVVVEAKVEAEGSWFWQGALSSRELKYEVRYHPLAGLFSVVDLETGIQERFATRQAATTMLGTLRNIEVIDEENLKPGASYRMAIRAYLDIESLPLPLRPLAYITPGWYLSTGWSRWLLRR